MRAGQRSRYGRICDTACRGNLRRGPENPGLRNGRGREITDHIEWNSNNESMLKEKGDGSKKGEVESFASVNQGFAR